LVYAGAFVEERIRSNIARVSLIVGWRSSAGRQIGGTSEGLSRPPHCGGHELAVAFVVGNCLPYE